MTVTTTNRINGHELVQIGNVRARLVDHEGELAFELVPSDVAHDGAPEIWLTVDMARLIAAQLEQVATLMERTHETRTPDLAHRPNCRCDKAARAKAAAMERESDWVSDLLGGQVLDAIDRKLLETGAEPMVRSLDGRYNAVGERVSTERMIRRCDALLFWDAFDDVLVAVGKRAKKAVNTVDTLET